MGSFDDYSYPNPQAAYSLYYFSTLNFEQTLELEFPTILSPSRIARWSFSSHTPSSGSSTIIIPGEFVPHINDLQPILREWGAQYQTGARSVDITFVSDNFGERVTKNFHFSKLRLFVNINNYATAFRRARELALHFTQNNRLSPLLLSRFLQEKITGQISGFQITHFQLSELGCLLDEEWLEEDLANALLELLYFRLAAESSTGTCPVLLLPTLFMANSRLLFNREPRTFSRNMVGLRERIATGDVAGVSLLHCDANHYSAYRLKGPELRHGDSLNLPPASDILPILQWLVKNADPDTPYNLYPSKVLAGKTEKQGPDSGSCGIASINFIQRDVDPQQPLWSDILSPLFRHKALQDLVVYHLCALDANLVTKPQSWIRPLSNFVGPDIQSLNNHTFFDDLLDYDDFNLYSPTSRHPIHLFLRLIKEQRSHPLSSLPPAQPDRGAAEETTLKSFKLALSPTPSPSLDNLPSFKLEKAEFLSPSTPKLNAHALDLTLELESPITLHPAQSCSSKLATPSSPVSAPQRPTPAQTLILKSRVSEELDANVIDLTMSSPPRPPTGESTQCRKPARKDIKEEAKPKIHDLTSPPQHPAKAEILDLTLSSPARPTAKPKHAKKEHGSAPTPLLELNTVFASFNEAQKAVYDHEAQRGHVWRIGQSKKDENGRIIKYTLRCNHYHLPTTSHSRNVDPADHRQGRSVRTDCKAHVNVRRSDGLWRLTLVELEHNHPREIPVGGTIRQKPTDVHREVVAEFANGGNFSRDQIKRILKNRIPDQELEPRQITNLLNQARRQAREDVKALGGDINAIIASLREKSSREHGWKYDIKLDENQMVVGLWWQSPEQGELLRRYSDILINDNSYNRNQYGYPLDIGIVIDNFGKSRNVWYSFHKAETTEIHSWVLQLHLEHAGRPPEVIATDRGPSLIAAIKERMPLTLHVVCLHHLLGNLDSNLRLRLGGEWSNFNNDFWATYRAVSPEEFDRLWHNLMSRYPTARSYLEDELYPCREQWAWAWISHTFTAGVRTNGRVESENRINKAIGGPKKSLLMVFNGLNERTNDQSRDEMIRMRELSRRHHATNLESLFARPLAIIRKYAGPFALHVCYKQMQESLYYNTEVVSRPAGTEKWNDWVAPKSEVEHTFAWSGNEEARMMNDFSNDHARISRRWMHRLVVSQGLRIDHVLRIVHKSTGIFHYLMILHDKRYVCDCSMPINLGIPCRHFFQAWTTVKGLPFHLALIRRRWYENPDIDVTDIPAVTQANEVRTQLLKISKEALQSVAFSNPLDRRSGQTPAPVTRTVGSREVYHTVQTAIRPYLAGIQTQEQVSAFINRFTALEEEDREQARRNTIHDPPILKHKGRPRTARITGALEGKTRGGGPRSLVPAKRRLSDILEESGEDEMEEQPAASQAKKARTYRCGICGQLGHNRSRCPKKV